MASIFDACALQPLKAYDVGFHIGGLFIVLAASTLGVFASMKFSSWTKTKESVKMFGIGVIAATGWVHLLPEAFSKFSNPCIGDGWTTYGTSYIGLFAMIAAFIVQIVEITAAGRVYPINVDEEREEKVELHIVELDTTKLAELIPYIADNIEVGQLSNCNDHVSVHNQDLHNSRMSWSDTDLEHSERGKIASLIVLESGVLIHSLIIGLSLGTTADYKFMPLLIAISFYQLFEGIVLGSLINTLKTSEETKLRMAMIYPLGTPSAMAVGIALRHNFNINSQKLILVEGVSDSLAAGILIYATYCELMSGITIWFNDSRNQS